MWNEAFNHLYETISNNSKSVIAFDGRELLHKIDFYRERLEHYINNYSKYDNTSSVQENDLKFTTNKFFTDVVAPIRDEAIDALKQLKIMIKETKTLNDKNFLTSCLMKTIYNTNMLIDCCMLVVEKTKPSLIKNLKKKNIDFKEKYNLMHLHIGNII